MEHNDQGATVLAGMKSMKIRRFLSYDASSEKITESLLKDGEF